MRYIAIKSGGIPLKEDLDPSQKFFTFIPEPAHDIRQLENEIKDATKTIKDFEIETIDFLVDQAILLERIR